MLSSTLTVHAASFPANQCAADRKGSDLGCTANDVQITGMAVVGDTTSCVGGTNVNLDLQMTVNFAVPDRYDIGIFISNDGKTPQTKAANGGAASCAVSVLPTASPFLDLDGGTTGDICGDGNGTIGGGTGSGIHYMPNVTVPCQSQSGASGNLYIPFVVSWDQNKTPPGEVCTSNLNPVPGGPSKCNSPDVVQGTVGVAVLPSITMTDGISTIFSGSSTNYTITITNTTGVALSNIVFTDPAVTGITANTLNCFAAGGATCPTSTVAAVQGAGITIPSMPVGSSLTYTLNATLTGNPSDTRTNTARVALGSQSNSASDTDIIVGAIAILPSTLAQNGDKGSTLTYNYTVYNYGVSTDNISLSVASSKGWTVTRSPTSVSVATGSSATVTVTVNIPSSATVGDVDTTTLTATSGINSSKTAIATAVTTVTTVLTLTPSNTGAGGAGSSVYYSHRVQSNSSSSKSVSLTPSFTSGTCTGWTSALFESDKSTSLTSPITLAANGGYKDFMLKVSIPSGAALNSTCTATLAAAYTSGTASTVSVTDVTSVKILVLYEDPGYTIEQYTYPAGNNVYAKSYGLTNGTPYYYKWFAPDGTLMRTSAITSNLVSLPDTYTIPTTGPLGTWTVQVINNTTGAIYVQSNFYVGPDHLKASYTGATPAVNTDTVVDLALHDRYNHVAPIDVASGNLVVGNPIDPEGPLMVTVTVSGSAQIISTTLSNATITGQSVTGKLNTSTGTATLTIRDSVGETVTITPVSYKSALYGSPSRDEPGTVIYQLAPPTVTKSFSTPTIGVNGTSTQTVILTNPNSAAMYGLAFTDTYPVNLKNAATPALSNTCGGTATGTAGGSALSLSGGTLTAGSSCTVSIVVTSATVGTYLNSTGAVSSTNAGSGTAASATLTVTAVDVVNSTVVASPVSVTADGSSTSTVTVTLKDGAGTAVAGKTVTLAAGSGSSTITTLVGTTNASGVATFTVKDSAVETVTYTATDTTDSVVVTQTAQVAFTRMTAPTVTQSFSAATMGVNGSSTLTITIANPNITAINGLAFTDTYPSTNLKNATTPVLANTCGGTATGTAGASVLSLSGGTVAAGQSCSVSVSVTSAVSGAYINDMGTVSSTNAGSATAATATLTVTAISTALSTVVANPTSVAADGSSTSTITVTLKDGAGTAVAGKTVTLAAGSGSSIISVASGASSALGIVTFTVKDSTAEGPITYTATDTTDNIVVTQTAQVTFSPATTIATGSDPSAASIAPGSGASDVDVFTLQTSGGTESITTVTVNLSTSSGVGRLAISNNAGTELGFTTSPATGSNVITVTGMSATTTLTNFKVRVMPLSHAAMLAPAGALYAITAPVTAWAGPNAHAGTDTNDNALTIDNLSPSAATAMSGQVGDANTTLNWTTSASSDFSATGGSVIYRWAAGAAGSEVPTEGSTPTKGGTNGAATVACVVSTATPSTAVVGVVDGTGGSSDCTTDALDNGLVYTYKIFQKDSNGNYDIGTALSTVAKSFSPSTITVNGTSTLSITIRNPGVTAISGLAFTDTYPSSNLKNAATPALANTCGGTATGTAGASVLSLSSGSVAAGGSCSISISVTAVALGSYTNSTLVTWTNSGSGTTASATLTVTAVALDHLRIKHDGEGANCAAENLTVEACANADCSTLATTGGITGTLEPFAALFNIGVSGFTTLTVSPSTTGSNTLSTSGISPTPTNIAATCLNTVTSAAICTMAVSGCSSGFECLEAGLSYGSGRLYTKLTGGDFSFDVVALNSSNAIESNYVATGATAKNVTVELFDDSTPAAFCSAYASPVASQTLSIDSSNAGRKATANFNVANAYKKLRCRVTDANGASTIYGCSSDDFSVRPQQFTLSTTPTLNPISPSTDKLAAGEDFNLIADPDVAAGYTGTPLVNLANVVDHGVPTPNTVGAALTWSNSSSTAVLGFPQAVGGSVSNSFQYNDVGTISFKTDAVTDSVYTGVDQSNDCIIGSTSNIADSSGMFGCTIGSSALEPLGRFYPHHFAVNASFTPGCAGAFTYMDNDALVIVLNVTAQSKTDVTATRYVSPASAYVPVATLDVKLLNGVSATDLLSRLSQPSVPARSWVAGVYTADGTYSFDARNAITPVMDGPYDSLKTQTAITDATDGVQITKLNGAVLSAAVSSIDSATSKVRFGRLSMDNAYGSELLPLSLPLKLEYYLSATQGWQLNTLDTCTTVAANNFAFSFPVSTTNNLAACETAMTVGGNAPNQTLTLASPGAGNTGWSDITLNLGAAALGMNTQCVGVGGADVPKNMPWLQSTGLTNPTARATFGIYKGNSKFIYIRELY